MKNDFSPLSTIIFDLDGTLINTAPDVRLAVNRTLALFSDKQINPAEIYELIGHGARFMLEGALKKVNITPSASDIQYALDYYLASYQADPVVETQIYPNVIDVLTDLKNANLQLAICTNKPSIMTHIVLEKLNLKHFFDLISSGDEVENPKPHADHLLGILKKMNRTIDEAVMIGDSNVDKMSAMNASIPFIGVSYGYGENLLEAQYMIANIDELAITLRSIYDSERR